jgi:hypothetical protein
MSPVPTHMYKQHKYWIYLSMWQRLGFGTFICTVLLSAECFVRVRSGQSLDHSVVKNILNVHSVGECELECLQSRSFTCRVFSYRYLYFEIIQ